MFQRTRIRQLPSFGVGIKFGQPSTWTIQKESNVDEFKLGFSEYLTSYTKTSTEVTTVFGLLGLAVNRTERYRIKFDQHHNKGTSAFTLHYSLNDHLPTAAAGGGGTRMLDAEKKAHEDAMKS